MKVDLYHAPPPHPPLCYHLPKPESASFLYRLDQFPQPEAHCLLLLQPMEAIVLPFFFVNLLFFFAALSSWD